MKEERISIFITSVMYVMWYQYTHIEYKMHNALYYITKKIYTIIYSNNNYHPKYNEFVNKRKTNKQTIYNHYHGFALKIVQKQISLYLLFYTFPLIMIPAGIIVHFGEEKILPITIFLTGTPIFVLLNKYEKRIFNIDRCKLYFKYFESKDSDWYKKQHKLKIVWVIFAYIMFLIGSFSFVGILILLE